MKKKPHQKQSVIKKVFSDFRKRLHNSNNQNGLRYEVIKEAKGYAVKVHKERGADEVIHFQTKEEMNVFLKKISK